MVSKKKGASKKAGQASKGETVGVLTLSYEEAKARLEHLEGLEQVSQNDLVEYYGVDQDPGELHARPSTQRKGNPNCLAGMVPSPEGTRVKGIWSKDHPSLCKPGDDPKQLRRSAPSQPTGLTNLGATCYVNALVQALFYVPPLRKGILHANDVLRADPAISQLRRIFAMMQAGPFSKVDSKPLVSTLRLPEDVQQDLQEFKTFLFGYLEERFAEAATQYDDVMKAFRGRESWAMRCEKCKKFSSKSTEVQRFYEVQVEPEHSRGLPVCLERAFASEEVEGVNCEHCKARRTFTRFHAVRELPEYLVLSVKRYKWDLRSGERKKINSQMQFPTSLDMGRILETSIYATDFGEELQKHCPYQPGSEGDVYQLQSLVLHRGTQAQAGHYVAHVRLPRPAPGKQANAAEQEGADELAESWWKFDDELVECLGDDPMGKPIREELPPGVKRRGRPRKRPLDPSEVPDSDRVADPAAAKSAKTSASATDVKQRGTRRATRDADGGGDQEMQCGPTGTAELAAAHDGTVAGGATAKDKASSKDVYLLIYKRGPKMPATLAADLPDDLQEAVQEESRKLDRRIERYDEKKKQSEEDLKQRRELVRMTMGCAQTAPRKVENTRWVPSDWLRQWCDALFGGPRRIPRSSDEADAAPEATGSAAPGEAMQSKGEQEDSLVDVGTPKLDLRPLLCAHKKLALDAVNGAVRITEVAYSCITQSSGPNKVELHEESPRDVDGATMCAECVLSALRRIVDQGTLSGEHSALKGVILDRLEGKTPAMSNGYLAHRRWVQNWCRRQTATAIQGSMTPTSSILCEHSQLKPSVSTSAGELTNTVFVLSADEFGYLKKCWENEGGICVVYGQPVDQDLVERTLVEVKYPGVETCVVCCEEKAATYAETKDEKAILRQQRTALRTLLQEDTLTEIEAGTVYRLIPSWWLNELRNYLKPSRGKDVPARPGDVGAALKPLLCTHQRLACVLPSIRSDRGKAHVDTGRGESDELALVAEDDWQQITNFYGGDGCPRIVAEAKAVTAQEEAAVAGPDDTADPGSMTEEDVLLSSRDTRAPGIALYSEPGVCLQCITDRKVEQKRSLLTYGENEADIEVILRLEKPDEDDPVFFSAKAALGETGHLREPPPGQGKRSRRQRREITGVCSTTPLKLVRLKIFEVLDVHPDSAHIYSRGRLLEEEEKTLGELEVYPDEVLVVHDTREHDPKDLTGIRLPDVQEQDGGMIGFGNSILGRG